MNWLLAAGEVTAGVALFVGLAVLVAFLRPPHGSLQERAIVRFPGAWILVGIPITLGFACSAMLVLIGVGILR